MDEEHLYIMVAATFPEFGRRLAAYLSQSQLRLSSGALIYSGRPIDAAPASASSPRRVGYHTRFLSPVRREPHGT